MDILKTGLDIAVLLFLFIDIYQQRSNLKEIEHLCEHVRINDNIIYQLMEGKNQKEKEEKVE